MPATEVATRLLNIILSQTLLTVYGNELADALDGQATIESSLTLHPATVLAHVSKQIETTQKD